jgi:hypothetical protein
MKVTFFAAIAIAVAVGSFQQLATATQIEVKGKPPGGVQLLDGYAHRALQGFDSQPGEITKKNGLRIMYDIGAIPKPGAPRFGGSYSDWTQRVEKENQRWYREHTINNQPVHLVYTKDKQLTVSYPKGGINFSCEAKTEEDLVDALLITLSYAGKPAKKK